MRDGPPVHLMRWSPQDWRTSRVRARSLLTGDPLLRLAYLELLSALYEAGGELPADPQALSDHLLLPADDIARVLPVLEDLGRTGRGGITISDGIVRNRRVSEEVAEARAYRAEQRRRGAAGAAKRWGNDGHGYGGGDSSGHDRRHVPPTAGYGERVAGASRSCSPPPPMPHPLPAPTPEEERGAAAPAPPELEDEARPGRKREVPPEADRFAHDFVAALRRAHGDGFKAPTPVAFEGWRQQARLMFERDGRHVDEARELAGWLFQSEHKDAAFWRRNVLGVPKFREQYDRLRAQWRAASEGGGRADDQGSRLRAFARS